MVDDDVDQALLLKDKRDKEKATYNGIEIQSLSLLSCMDTHMMVGRK
jgi:hypothetical protein